MSLPREEWRPLARTPLRFAGHMLLSALLLLPIGASFTWGLVEGVRTLVTGERAYQHHRPSPTLLEPLLLLGIGALFGPLLLVNGLTSALDLLGAERTLEGPVTVRRRRNRSGPFVELLVNDVAVEVPPAVAAAVRDEDVVRLRCGRFHHELKALARREAGLT